MKNQKASTTTWIIIAIIIIALGIGAYFLLTGDASPLAGGSSIPSPPPLPS